ncbi:hypothetical protein THAOC_19121, partial [Thalassiosira oceanica]
MVPPLPGAGKEATYLPHHGNVCDNSKFNVPYVKSFDLVLNALDNVAARGHGRVPRPGDRHRPAQRDGVLRVPGQAGPEGVPHLHDQEHAQPAGALHRLGEGDVQALLRPEGRGQHAFRGRGEPEGGLGGGRRRKKAEAEGGDDKGGDNGEGGGESGNGGERTNGAAAGGEKSTYMDAVTRLRDLMSIGVGRRREAVERGRLLRPVRRPDRPVGPLRRRDTEADRHGPVQDGRPRARPGGGVRPRILRRRGGAAPEREGGVPAHRRLERVRLRRGAGLVLRRGGVLDVAAAPG